MNSHVLCLCSVASLPGDLQMTNAEFFAKYQFPKPLSDQGHRVAFHCQSGKRALRAAEKAWLLGFKNVAVYKGSFGEWVQRGAPIAKVTGP